MHKKSPSRFCYLRDIVETYPLQTANTRLAQLCQTLCAKKPSKIVIPKAAYKMQMNLTFCRLQPTEWIRNTYKLNLGKRSEIIIFVLL